MFKFFFKKNFCDVWDNLFYVIITNFVSLVAMMLGITAFTFLRYLGETTGFRTLFLVTGEFAFLVLVFPVVFAHSENLRRIVSYETPHYGEFFRGLGPNFLDGLKFAVLFWILAAVVSVSMPWYFRQWTSTESSFRLVFAFSLGLIFWFSVVTILAFQWFIPVKVLLGNSFFKTLKKSYILFFDNAAFSFGLGLLNLLNVVVSFVTFGLLPGFCGISVTCTNALKLRLYKYDWLEVNPNLTPAERKDVPWNDLLEKDRKTVGKRSIKSFIFPWKD